MSHHNRLSNDTTSSQSIDLKIFIKDVHDIHGRKRPLTVRPWASIKDVKDQLTKHLHIPASSQAIYFGPLLSSAKELPNHRTLQDAGIYRNGETLLLEIKGQGGSSLAPGGGGLMKKSSSSSSSHHHSISSLRNQSNDVCVSSSTLDLCPKSLQRLVQQSRRGLALGFKPALAPDGSGGSYFLIDARKKRVGVFKPADEEPFAENNPRGYVPHNGGDATNNGDDNAEWLRQGIRPGELCLREVAAFLLDHDGFSSVPMTTLAEARHPALHTAGQHWTLSEGGAGVGIHSITPSPLLMTSTQQSSSSPSSNQELAKKVGSFQEYVHAECTMDDLSPSKISVDEVHKIAILDIRLMNADRNVANILCQRIPEDPDHFRLIPIDHGYSLRSKCDVAWFDWCWLDWPQLKQPLSKSSKDYVLGLDIEADVRLLRERLNFQNDVLDYFRSSCLILKAGVRAGLTLYDICSEIMCRNDPSGEVPSKLETLTAMASELAMSAVHNGRFHHATASMALEEQLASRRRSMMVGSQQGLSYKLPSTSTFKSKIVRSASSSVFSQVTSIGGESVFTDEYESSSRLNSFSADFHDSQTSSNNCSQPPGMVQSSQSDNSFDGDDDDAVSFTSASPEDCAAVEWAEALVAVADKSMDNGQRDRSVSESSDSTNGSNDSSFSQSSSSAVGFWYIRPGSSSLEKDGSEDDDTTSSICWTPSLQSSSQNGTADPPPLNINDKDGPPHILSPSGFSASNLDKLLTETTLDDESSPSNNADDEFGGPVTPDTMNQMPDEVGCLSSFKPIKKMMSRSMSYSAFSTSNSTLPRTDSQPNQLYQSTAGARNSLSSVQERDIFRTYYVKFINLLVLRETERMIQSKVNEG